MSAPRGYAGIGLVRPKNAANVGHVMRASHCFDVAFVALAGPRNHVQKQLKRNPTNVTKAHRHLPTIIVEDLFSIIPQGAVPVAVDLLPDAVSLVDFTHPSAAFYIFGPEDGTLGSSIYNRCGHRVMVPTRHCLNLAMTVNIVLYDRIAKQQKERRP